MDKMNELNFRMMIFNFEKSSTVNYDEVINFTAV